MARTRADREAATADREKTDFSALNSGRRYVDTISNSNLFAIDITTSVTDGATLRRQVVVALQGRSGFLILERRPMPVSPIESPD